MSNPVFSKLWTPRSQSRCRLRLPLRLLEWSHRWKLLCVWRIFSTHGPSELPVGDVQICARGGPAS